MRHLLPVHTLLLAIFLFMAGTGALPAVIGIRLDSAGYSTLVAGLLGTAYFAGLTIGSMMALRLIGQVGHIRAFAACVSLISASTLAYSLAQSIPVWFALRLVNGLCVACVFVCLESWLNDRADPQQRGRVLGSYMIALYAGQALSQLTLGVEPGNPRLPFVIASIILSLTVIPVALTRMAAPPQDEQVLLGTRALYDTSPLGLVGVVCTGIMLGAFYTMAPIHALRTGLSNLETASLIGIVIAGGMALQWPLGWLSDHFDRRKVIVATFAATAVICVLVAAKPQSALLLPLGALFGGFAFALYPLCVAHTNDHLSKSERTAASGGLVLAYSAGACIGPFAAAAGMRLLDASGLYWFMGASAGLVFLFGLWRQIVSSPVPSDVQHSFQPLPRTTPVVAALDAELPVDDPEGRSG